MQKNALISLLFSITVLLLSGCATKENPDPYESMNRAIFSFNTQANKYVVGPATDAYVYAIPASPRNGIDNFFNNLGNVGNVINDLLQAEWYWAYNDTGRFVLNTIFGVFGFFDVAKTVGLYRHPQNFGITLGKWGYKNSAYFVIPILGPSTIRDTAALIPDYWVYPLQYDEINFPYNLAITGIYGLNLSSKYLPQLNNLTEFAFDPYIAARNAYLQYINHLIDPKENSDNDMNIRERSRLPTNY
ncbi:VacJ family lipoprotein [Thiotrichales bacterium 19S9-12]|nr:VacJ family lipoprotein [Thiotrichales bacterium 19S9-11]MCF6811527.1 VacJ family lipoprotein [Thiotrichales bacterium 19S9-12]